MLTTTSTTEQVAQPKSWKLLNRTWKIFFLAIVYLVQFLITIYVLGLAVVSYWRGTWNLLSLYFYPKNQVIHSMICISVGTATIAFIHILRFPLNYLHMIKDRQTQKWNLIILSVIYKLLQIVFLYFAAFSGVCLWKGFWTLMDLWVVIWSPEASAWMCHIIGVIVAGFLNSMFALTAPPSFVLVEKGGEVAELNWNMIEEYLPRVVQFVSNLSTRGSGTNENHAATVELKEIVVDTIVVPSNAPDVDPLAISAETTTVNQVDVVCD